MNWITNIVRPRIKGLMGGKDRGDTPENLWKKCPSCGAMVFHRALVTNLNVCPNSGHPLRIGPAQAFASTFDRRPLAAPGPPPWHAQRRPPPRTRRPAAALGCPDGAVNQGFDPPVEREQRKPAQESVARVIEVDDFAPEDLSPIYKKPVGVHQFLQELGETRAAG